MNMIDKKQESFIDLLKNEQNEEKHKETDIQSNHPINMLTLSKSRSLVIPSLQNDLIKPQNE